MCRTAGGGGVGQGEGLVSGRQPPQQVGALCGHGGGRRPLVHLLGGDVVVEQRLAVLQRRRVREAADEVGVGGGVGRVRGQVAGQVVGSCRGGRGGGSRQSKDRTEDQDR